AALRRSRPPGRTTGPRRSTASPAPEGRGPGPRGDRTPRSPHPRQPAAGVREQPRARDGPRDAAWTRHGHLWPVIRQGWQHERARGLPTTILLVETVVSEASSHVKVPQTRLTYRRCAKAHAHGSLPSAGGSARSSLTIPSKVRRSFSLTVTGATMKRAFPPGA